MKWPMWQNDNRTTWTVFLAVLAGVAILIVVGVVLARWRRRRRMATYDHSVEGEIVAFRDGDVQFHPGWRHAGWRRLPPHEMQGSYLRQIIGKDVRIPPKSVNVWCYVDVLYRVGGQEYYVSQMVPNDYEETHKHGDKVTVWYDAAHPQNAVADVAEEAGETGKDPGEL